MNTLYKTLSNKQHLNSQSSHSFKDNRINFLCWFNKNMQSQGFILEYMKLMSNTLDMPRIIIILNIHAFPSKRDQLYEFIFPFCPFQNNFIFKLSALRLYLTVSVQIFLSLLLPLKVPITSKTINFSYCYIYVPLYTWPSHLIRVLSS